jgi:hypothetical protein
MRRLAMFIFRVLLDVPGATLMDMVFGLTMRPSGAAYEAQFQPPAFVTMGRNHADPMVRISSGMTSTGRATPRAATR